MKLVAVAAHSEAPSFEHRERISEFVKSLTTYCGNSVVLLVGGYWGFMKTLVDEALTAGLRVVVFPPVEREDVWFPEDAIVLRTGLSFRLRSVAMVRSSDALAVLGGASGTIQEVVTAYTEGKPVFALLSGLPSDRVAGLGPYLDDRKTSEIRVYSDANTLARDLCEYLTRAERRLSKTG
ncbi:MAG: LOG family protein [Sulfolobales archaeon]